MCLLLFPSGRSSFGFYRYACVHGGGDGWEAHGTEQVNARTGRNQTRAEADKDGRARATPLDERAATAGAAEGGGGESARLGASANIRCC